MLQLTQPQDLVSTLLPLLTDEQRRSAMGNAAREVVLANRGARAKLLALIGEQLAGT